MKKVIVVMSIIIIGVWFLMSAMIGLVEGQEPDAAIDPTATAPLPTCSDAGVDCFTPTPTRDGHWINPEPWPTYSYPTPEGYPAPYPTPEPEGYPEAYPDDYHKAPSIPFEETSKKNSVPEPSLGNSIWAWILDLFTN